MVSGLYLEAGVSLLVPDPEEAEQHGVQLPVNAHAALPQPREGLLRHVAAVSDVQLRQGPAVLAHRAHTCTTHSVKTSLKSLRLRKLLDQSVFAFWALLVLLSPLSSFWVLLGPSVPYWSFLGLTYAFVH